MPRGAARIALEEIRWVEWEVNERIQRNVPIKCWFPAPEEFQKLLLRSRLSEHVRVVAIGDDEMVACAAFSFSMNFIRAHASVCLLAWHKPVRSLPERHQNCLDMQMTGIKNRREPFFNEIHLKIASYRLKIKARPRKPCPSVTGRLLSFVLCFGNSPQGAKVLSISSAGKSWFLSEALLAHPILIYDRENGFSTQFGGRKAIFQEMDVQ